jgi:hypothetical protein
MRRLAFVLVVLGCWCGVPAAPAAQSNDCKEYREDLRACVKAHSQGACKANYDICMKRCRKK